MNASRGDLAEQDVIQPVNEAIRACPGIDTSGILVTLVQGGVALRGSLQTMDHRDAVARAALRTHGVTSIADELDVPQYRRHPLQ